MKHLITYNESVRDKMTGLSDKISEYRKSFVYLIEQITTKFDIDVTYVDRKSQCDLYIEDNTIIDALLKWIKDNSEFTIKDCTPIKPRVTRITISRTEKIHESVRDMMKPKSKEELDVVWEKYETILKSIKDKYPLWTYVLMPNGKIKMNWNKIIKKYGDNMGESIRLDIMKILKKHDILTCYDRMYNEETFQKRIFGELPEWTNESIRDKMTPKSKEDINLMMGEILGGVKSALTMYPMKINETFDKVCEIFKSERKDIFIIYEGEDGYDTVNTYFQDLIDELNDTTIDGDDGSYELYPELKIGFFFPKDLEEPMGWFYCKKDYVLNEGIKDMMTPKSDRDIKSALRMLSPQELYSRLMHAITGDDMETFKLVLPLIKMDTRQQLMACNLATDERMYDVFEMLLQTGLSDETLVTLTTRISEMGMSDRAKKEFLDLIQKYTKMLEGVGNTSVKDLMTGKSEAELRQSVENLSSGEKLLKGCLYGFMWLVEEALSEGVDVNYTNDFDNGALVIASANGHLDVIKLLVKNGLDIHKMKSITSFGEKRSDRSVGSLALCWACVKGHEEVVKYLLESGVIPDVENWDKWSKEQITPYMYRLLRKYMVKENK